MSLLFHHAKRPVGLELRSVILMGSIVIESDGKRLACLFCERFWTLKNESCRRPFHNLCDFLPKSACLLLKKRLRTPTTCSISGIVWRSLLAESFRVYEMIQPSACCPISDRNCRVLDEISRVLKSLSRIHGSEVDPVTLLAASVVWTTPTHCQERMGPEMLNVNAPQPRSMFNAQFINVNTVNKIQAQHSDARLTQGRWCPMT